MLDHGGHVTAASSLGCAPVHCMQRSCSSAAAPQSGEPPSMHAAPAGGDATASPTGSNAAAVTGGGSPAVGSGGDSAAVTSDIADVTIASTAVTSDGRPRLQGDMVILFTCVKCDTRSAKSFNRWEWWGREGGWA